jgi:predicted flap endonuclease-1-like 5' DNA nuclease
MGGKLGFVAGALVGAAGAAAYFLWRGSAATSPQAGTGGFAQSRGPLQTPDFSAASASELARLRDDLQRAQNSLAERGVELAGLRTQVGQADWQTRTPALAALGRQLAALPPTKQLAADRAVAGQRLPQVTTAPQDLASVNGIGGVFEQRLYAAGIGSYWELANLSDADFAEILELTDLQRAAFDGAVIRAQAEALAAATGTVGQLWDGVAPDDLEPIKGIGKVFEQRLYDAGIRTYARLAAATPEELAGICGANMPVKPDFASWIEQARGLLSQQS